MLDLYTVMNSTDANIIRKAFAYAEESVIDERRVKLWDDVVPQTAPLEKGDEWYEPPTKAQMESIDRLIYENFMDDELFRSKLWKYAEGLDFKVAGEFIGNLKILNRTPSEAQRNFTRSLCQHERFGEQLKTKWLDIIHNDRSVLDDKKKYYDATQTLVLMKNELEKASLTDAEYWDLVKKWRTATGRELADEVAISKDGKRTPYRDLIDHHNYDGIMSMLDSFIKINGTIRNREERQQNYRNSFYDDHRGVKKSEYNGIAKEDTLINCGISEVTEAEHNAVIKREMQKKRAKRKEEEAKKREEYMKKMKERDEALAEVWRTMESPADKWRRRRK